MDHVKKNRTCRRSATNSFYTGREVYVAGLDQYVSDYMSSGSKYIIVFKRFTWRTDQKCYQNGCEILRTVGEM